MRAQRAARSTRLGAICLGAATATVLGLFGAVTQAHAGPAEGRVLGEGGADTVSGRYLVVLDGAPSLRAAATAETAGEAKTLTDRHGGAVRQLYTAALKGFSVKATPEQARRLAAAPGVRYVQADTVFHVSGTQPNPPSWGIDRVDGAKDSSYAYPNDGSGVTAYIADTGLYRQHADFGSRASSGYDFIDNDADSADCHGHGTHVSGTVGGTSYGVAKNVKLVGVRVLDCQGSGSTEQIAAGMDWIARNAKKPAVVNMSLGGSADRALDDAVAGVISAGIPVAVAAGNDSKDACNTSPARLPAAITLGSTDSNDARSSFSNYGSCLDLFAPGGSIVSTKMGGGTQTMSGTSMATPHTAGAAALYLSAHPDATPQQVRDALVDNAQSGVVTGAGSGSPNKFLNVTKLGAPTQPGEPVAEFTAQCSTSAASCAFDASASKDPDGSIASYAWEFGDGAKGEGAKPSHEYSAAGTYSVKLTVTDNSGRTATVTKPVTAGTTQPPAGTPPTAAFSVSCWYQDCSFDASASKDSDGSIASYKWKFGDSATGTGATAAHRYPAGQRSYTAELTVTDNSGLTGTASRRIDCYGFGTGQSLCFAS
ncbi:S8 family serine peptidase [Streptomyces sp. NPDC058401]|uniref:S8 family serine peptidase n=1 Tax=Streptomyces sp. NPDC058401 TaxID=3346480 RepID=UPI003664EDEC